MIQLRPAKERGHFNHGWLDTHHTFSFADYYDPSHMGFSALRVINEDFVAPAKGFPTHGHRDMEIITWILEGALEHKDSLGNGSVIRPGDAQRMSAGSGIRHSEFNPSNTESVHLLQIWLLPNQQGIAPGYEQTHFDDSALANRLCLIASPEGHEGSVTIHQDARVYAARLNGAEITHTLSPKRRAWMQVARGDVMLNGHQFTAGDGAGIENEPVIRMAAGATAEILLFDLP